ncbi:hypothetical protein CIW48_19795 [Methylobacterium sp. P1-11]|uniref:hypothetical protein n=1 Tax=Methylobacterium sp. P1-11 TaxID=2024616 RepID=UPI0011ED8F1B|nr:hypothetical protein [Methylobacterium sp. P1-11]KAA0122236.1 hypothetical protein CIW48_19795 [Methylobacterium sp. P1-11]
MTEHPASRYVEVVSLRAEPSFVVLKAQKRQMEDAPEPGFVLDPNTGKARRAWQPRRRAWLEFPR